MYNELTWKNGEKFTREYMENHGYKIVYTNFSCVGVELDIVSILPSKIQKKNLKLELKEKIKIKESSQDKKILKKSYKNLIKNATDLLVITEVKSRKTNLFGTGKDSINEYKINNIKKGARYLITKKEFKNMQIRYDVASVDAGEIDYIENAFV